MNQYNPCFWVAIFFVTLAAIGFFASLGIVSRTAYHSGFAAGFAEARARFERIIRAAKAEKLFRGLLDDIERGNK